MNNSFKASVVIPVYNEVGNIRPLIRRIQAVFREISCGYEIIFSMDPCSDGTREAILEARQQDENIKLIELSRRFGQPIAILAGLDFCSGDCCVVMDADLQDPPELIKAMLVKWQEGHDVVYARRVSRKNDPITKKLASALFYKFINRISDIPIPPDTGEFRLMSRQVVDYVRQVKDREGFLRGLVAYVGFPQTSVEFDREVRNAGKGKYNPFFGSLKVALNGIVGYSKYPLNFISTVGFLISIFSFLFGFTYIILRLCKVEVPWGNPALVIIICFLSGIQLLCLGIMGQYIARMYDDIKGRPIYIIRSTHGVTLPAPPRNLRP